LDASTAGAALIWLSQAVCCAQGKQNGKAELYFERCCLYPSAEIGAGQLKELFKFYGVGWRSWSCSATFYGLVAKAATRSDSALHLLQCSHVC